MPSSSSPRSADTDPKESWLPALIALAEAALPDFLMRQRWYPAKDAGRPAVVLSVLVPFPMPGMSAAIAVWHASPPGQAPLRLFVPLARMPADVADAAQVIATLPEDGRFADPQVLVEAFSVDAFVQSWVGSLLHEEGVERGKVDDTGAARVRANRTAHLQRMGLEAAEGWPIRRAGGEQSNTSIRIDDVAILKVIRKLEDGIHPELEMGRFLSAETGFTATPALLGWTELAGADEAPSSTLSILQAYVPNAGDGWRWMLERLDCAAAAGGRFEKAIEDANRWLRRLGVRTAEMHRAFGADTEDPAFQAEPVRLADLQRWTDASQAMAARALDGLAAAGERLEPAAQARAALLSERRSLLEERLAELLRHPVAFAKTRHHGDYHLGQVLVTGDDAVIVDFEGEPLRSITDRRTKHAPLRDVAGMLRSLAYVAAGAGRRLAQDMPATERAAALARLASWEKAATGAFLDAYFEAARDMPGCPSDRAAAMRVVRFFMLEKALYEVAYELANRPDWVAIPLQGILDLLGLDAAATTRAHRMPFGAQLQGNGSVRFCLWAPSHAGIRVELDGEPQPLPMRPGSDGWHEIVTDRAGAGSRYRFVLPDGLRVPDPASRYQPQDVHGPSEVVNPEAYSWGDSGWKGRPWEEAVVYELHVGAFTAQGTFRAAIDKLDHLEALGVTAIELMPIADFPGRWNWGYDGVLPYAPDGTYGRPEDLKALVEAAHQRGLMVLLDVVYNHFGPEGAYLHAIAPETFTDRHKTPWGAAINTDGDRAAPVREFFIHNAIYWLEEFHLDGLRLDAVHAIRDDGPKHFLEELAERVRASVPDRHIHLVLENEENQPRWLARGDGARPLRYTAQWNDDVHHVLHVAVSGESEGYYADYHGDTGRLGRALAEGFAFQGEIMPYRGRARGEPSAALPTVAFVAFLQNHDQVGNRAFGERVTAIAPPEAVRAAAAVYLLLPQIPMLFMGEEWGAAQPFPFFCDFGPELADAVRQGRREEFARFAKFQDPAMRERIPDPTSKDTFVRAKLGWDDVAHEQHAGSLEWYRRVLAVRHAEIMPRLAGIRAGGRYEAIAEGAIVVRWPLDEHGSELVLAANLSPDSVKGFPPAAGRMLWREGEAGEGEAGEDETFGPWAVRWSMERKPVPIEEPAAALDRLAQSMGIELAFRDARGKRVRASAQTKRSLLAAMGVKAANDAQARQALSALDRADWLRPLPPVQVARADEAGPATVALILPAGTRWIDWRLTLEDGTERSARVEFDRLALIDERRVDGRSLQRRRLVLTGDLPWGYHRLAIEPGGARMALVVTPSRCWLPPALAEGRRLWGVAAQLYLLRSARDWGIGDFTDLGSLVALAAARGAEAIGLNPLHAMFTDDPAHASPYSPASRLLLNILYIDVAAVPELRHSEAARELLDSAAFRHQLDARRAQPLVDYTGVSGSKLQVLEMLFEACRASSDPTRWQAFEAFQRERGEGLERTCRYFALREHFATRNSVLADWQHWPEEYRDPASPAVARFVDENRNRIDFQAWLQWVADEQLGAAAAIAGQLGMSVGLYRDLAVGADRGGAETWANAAAVVTGAQIGAPPDIYNPAGQDWGLPPFHPRALREECYRSFVELLRANMRHAGGLRIDHVMGLQHLYWIPQGREPSAGAYVQYPMEDLIGILALESHRRKCLVVGEDLGTVPKGFRERMSQANVLSYRVLFFEQDEKTRAFLPPAAYPALALAVVGSHDLPTLRGWWEGKDLELKERLGLFPGPDEARLQRQQREAEQTGLLEALRREGLLPAPGVPAFDAVMRAAHAYLARSPSMLAMVQVDDLTDESEPVNVPGTSQEHPNWRRRLSLTLEDLAAAPRYHDIARIMNEGRCDR